MFETCVHLRENYTGFYNMLREKMYNQDSPNMSDDSVKRFRGKLKDYKGRAEESFLAAILLFFIKETLLVRDPFNPSHKRTRDEAESNQEELYPDDTARYVPKF